MVTFCNSLSASSVSVMRQDTWIQLQMNCRDWQRREIPVQLQMQCLMHRIRSANSAIFVGMDTLIQMAIIIAINVCIFMKRMQSESKFIISYQFNEFRVILNVMFRLNESFKVFSKSSSSTESTADFT